MYLMLRLSEIIIFLNVGEAVKSEGKLKKLNSVSEMQFC